MRCPHPSHSWDATAQHSEGEGKVCWALLPCHMQLLLKQCSSARAESHPSSFQILSRKILPENSSYKPLLSSLEHVAGRQCTPSNNPSHAPGQLLGSSIYLLSKFRHRFSSSGSAEVWKLCFTRLMVGKFKFSYSPSAGGGFSFHEAHSSKHAGSARWFQKHVFMVAPYFASNVSTWVANTV